MRGGGKGRAECLYYLARYGLFRQGAIQLVSTLPLLPSLIGRLSGVRIVKAARYPLIFIAVLAVAQALWFTIERAWFSDCVLRGVWVGTTALGGMDREAARASLVKLNRALLKTPIRVRLGKDVFSTSFRKLGAELDIERTLKSAFDAGRAGTIGGQWRFWLARLMTPYPVSAAVRLRGDSANKELSQLELQAIKTRPSEGSVTFNDAELHLELPHAGDRVARARLAEALAAAADFKTSTIALPTERVSPRLKPEAARKAAAEARLIVQSKVQLTSRDGRLTVVFDAADLKAGLRSRPAKTRLELFFDEQEIEKRIEPLREKLEAAPRNAQFFVDSKNKISIIPSRPGSEISAGEVAQALLQAAFASARVGELPVRRGVEPKLTTVRARELGIKKLVGQFTTRHHCCQDRVKNIHHIADLLDGVVLEPGETFSVNDYVGPRTKKNGFVEAPTIELGEMVDSLGGGISQFATTLFNAVFRAGYDIIQRQPHSYWFPRYPMGIEATLSYPTPDVIFKNDTKAGLLVKTEYTATSITVKLYGDTDGLRVSSKVSQKQDIVEPPMELVADDSVPPDEERVVQGGMIGWTVHVTRIRTYPDGSSKKERRKVVYQPRARRIAVHSCRIPEGEPDYTGEPCPEPEDVLLDAGADAEPEPDAEPAE